MQSPLPAGTPIPQPQKLPVEPLWTIQDFAKFLGRSVHGAYKVVERHKVPHYKPGGLLRFDPAEVRKWLEQYTVNGDQQRKVDPPSGARV